MIFLLIFSDNYKDFVKEELIRVFGFNMSSFIEKFNTDDIGSNLMQKLIIFKMQFVSLNFSKFFVTFIIVLFFFLFFNFYSF